jgi:hypothetical protein
MSFWSLPGSRTNTVPTRKRGNAVFRGAAFGFGLRELVPKVGASSVLTSSLRGGERVADDLQGVAQPPVLASISQRHEIRFGINTTEL